jgi:predicted RNase H-like HicB family nuclease
VKHPNQVTTFGLKVEFSREKDGRWIADVPALPGVTVYGRTRKKALASAESLALRVIVDRMANAPRPENERAAAAKIGGLTRPFGITSTFLPETASL